MRLFTTEHEQMRMAELRKSTDVILWRELARAVVDLKPGSREMEVANAIFTKLAPFEKVLCRGEIKIIREARIAERENGK